MKTAARQRKTKPQKPVVNAPVPDQDKPEYVSINWLAKKFGKSRSAIHRAVKAGKIKSLPFPTVGEKDQVVIPYSEVERIEAGRGGE